MALKCEQLIVWQKAVDFSADIHCVTRKFPREEQYILTSQIKRAADSIALNVAEGSTGQSNAEFRQFLGYAIRSAVEVVTCLHLGKRRQLLNEQEFPRLYQKAEELIKMTQGLRNALD